MDSEQDVDGKEEEDKDGDLTGEEQQRGQGALLFRFHFGHALLIGRTSHVGPVCASYGPFERQPENTIGSIQISRGNGMTRALCRASCELEGIRERRAGLSWRHVNPTVVLEIVC